MTSDKDLAGLPEDVRDAIGDVSVILTSRAPGMLARYATIRAELLRLAHKDAAWLSRWNSAVNRYERAEAEAAALKRRIAEAPTMRLTFGPTVLPALHDYDPNKLTAISNKRVAMLPVGG